MNTQNDELIMPLINLVGGKSAVVDDRTLLIMLILQKMENEALALIATGKSQPEYVNKLKRTALWYATGYGLEKVALALIAIGKNEMFQPDSVNYTALMNACSEKKMEKVALALIATGKSKPEWISESKSTALIYACCHNMVTVALALLETGQSNYQTKANNGYDALYFAKRNNMTKVVEKIELLMNQTSSTLTSSTLKCLSCKRDLDKKTHVVVPCGHSEFHINCLLHMKSCPACQTDVSTIVKLQ